MSSKLLILFAEYEWCPTVRSAIKMGNANQRSWYRHKCTLAIFREFWGNKCNFSLNAWFFWRWIPLHIRRVSVSISSIIVVIFCTLQCCRDPITWKYHIHWQECDLYWKFNLTREIKICCSHMTFYCKLSTLHQIEKSVFFEC